jgi:dihydrofolate reductase
MARLIYSMLTSLDGYTEDGQGDFGWGAPDDAGLHSYINELSSSVGTYLYGRRMYETMLFWETAHTLPDLPQPILDYARIWQAAEKVVFSRTLAGPQSARTRIEADAGHDITIDGPELAAQAIRAGLVDEFQPIVCPVVVGGGKRFFPDGVRLGLELVEERRFDNGVVVLRYTARG